jgi:glucose-1-phosphate cytidylyltransferase
VTVTTVILCGGKGTRAWPHTETVPKPLLEVSGRPVLEHVMEIYAAQGFDRFVLAAGYRCADIEAFARTTPSSWDVEVLDTGEDTNTGGRVWRCRDVVTDPFFVTYADGLGDVDLAALLEFHQGHDGDATMTTVPLPSQYGTIEFDDAGRVARFREKPRLDGHFINAGYFAFDGAVFERWEGEDLEREVLPALGAAGRLFARPHHGFWKSMDTYKDGLELTELGRATPPPWMPA